MAFPSSKDSSMTPVMQQYLRAKEQHPDAIIFFRLGDFYEMFFDDAERIAKLLNLTLTARGQSADGQKIPMAGVPHHAASTYIAKLLGHGLRVALCEQMADPSKVRGIVPREVVRVISPALCLDEQAIDARCPNHLVALLQSDKGSYGLAALELSTGECRACVLPHASQVIAELVRLETRELLIPATLREISAELSHLLPRCVIRERDRSAVPEDLSQWFARHFPASQRSWQELPRDAYVAVFHALDYALRSVPSLADNLLRIEPYDPTTDLILDERAVHHLELLRSTEGEKEGSLVHAIDATCTSMGSRLLRRRMLAPLTDLDAINRRLDAVELLVNQPALRTNLRKCMTQLLDLQRLSVRVQHRFASPRDLGGIRKTLASAIDMRNYLVREHQALGMSKTQAWAELMIEDTCEDLYTTLEAALCDELPALSSQGHIFRAGYHAQLDDLLKRDDAIREALANFERHERERTGIATLKVRDTRNGGYFIEISKAKLNALPADYQRKQTLAGTERFTTQALQELQDELQHIQDARLALEQELFEALCGQLNAQSARLHKLALMLAQNDVHACLADVAHRHRYVRPQLDSGLALELKAARHPVVEQSLAEGTFTANDVVLDVDHKGTMMITGPNMAGKSTVMRQTALVVILAHMGSFVPAAQARIGWVDRIFTRVGAHDRLAMGQSTFMVEMHETAEILRHASRRSLVVLDEIGRGTSTYDGVAIAWSVVEYLQTQIGSRTMFATHYHELCRLEDEHAGIINYNVLARFNDDRIELVHRLVPGRADRSYGVEVAALAGLPEVVIGRARDILQGLNHDEAKSKSSVT